MHMLKRPRPPIRMNRNGGLNEAEELKAEAQGSNLQDVAPPVEGGCQQDVEEKGLRTHLPKFPQSRR